METTFAAKDSKMATLIDSQKWSVYRDTNQVRKRRQSVQEPNQEKRRRCQTLNDHDGKFHSERVHQSYSDSLLRPAKRKGRDESEESDIEALILGIEMLQIEDQSSTGACKKRKLEEASSDVPSHVHLSDSRTALANVAENGQPSTCDENAAISITTSGNQYSSCDSCLSYRSYVSDYSGDDECSFNENRKARRRRNRKSYAARLLDVDSESEFEPDYEW